MNATKTFALIRVHSRRDNIVAMITFRPAQAADIPRMAALRAREWGTEPYWMERITGYLHRTVSAQQAQADRAAFVAQDGDLLAGFVAGHRTRRHGCHAELEWINVAEASRGAGLGRLLLAQIGAWFVEQGARRVCVNVEPDNAAARRLYERCSAQPFKTHWMIWEDSRSMLLPVQSSANHPATKRRTPGVGSPNEPPTG
jgi:ribosomal protein S18 acetylase RimI-like enzyme